MNRNSPFWSVLLALVIGVLGAVLLASFSCDEGDPLCVVRGK